MFYSQFILAKKGPLGTIWIAAHLERKLRKNQVADTDIGVSVDSIIFPDVPIALRLSSHLLLGVVRIYSRKVNYLFDDCSEALLKIKQAFRSTAVDLPPEESTAPYHSITLPETFDLDDFELPDQELYQGNYVDHHISNKEQITLQDTMDGVAFSTSQFGLDERFGDGDTSQIGLDLDEDLLLNKPPAPENDRDEMDVDHVLNSSGHQVESTINDYKREVTELAKLTQAEPSEPELASVILNSSVDSGHVKLVEYAQAPATPRLAEEPNLSNQKAFPSDKLNESEKHQPETVTHEKPTETLHSSLPGEEMEGNQFPDIDTINVEQKDNISIGQQVKKSIPNLENPDVALGKACDLTTLPDQPCSETGDHPENSVSLLSNGYQLDRQGKMHPDASNSFMVASQVEESSSPSNIFALNGSVSQRCQALHACNSRMVHDNLSNSKVDTCCDLPSESPPTLNKNEDLQGDGAKIQESQPIVLSGNDLVTDTPVESVNKMNQSTEQVQTNHSGLNSKTESSITQHCNEVSFPSPMSELPAPEKLLSVPEQHAELSSNLIPDTTTPAKVLSATTEDGTGVTTGIKRSFTESTLTVDSMHTAESSGQNRLGKTAESIPDDEDLLSSILVGRRSSILKLKPTPTQTEAVSLKRPRIVSRSITYKRKVLMDDAMVLHGDMIREQLVRTEDIRRVRKKAPCTHQEIWMIQKQYLEEDIVYDPISTGMSMELVCLHNQAYELSGISISKIDDSMIPMKSTHEIQPPRDTNFISDIPNGVIEELNVESQLGTISMEMENQPPEGDVSYIGQDNIHLHKVDCTASLQLATSLEQAPISEMEIGDESVAVVEPTEAPSPASVIPVGIAETTADYAIMVADGTNNCSQVNIEASSLNHSSKEVSHSHVAAVDDENGSLFCVVSETLNESLTKEVNSSGCVQDTEFLEQHTATETHDHETLGNDGYIEAGPSFSVDPDVYMEKSYPTGEHNEISCEFDERPRQTNGTRESDSAVVEDYNGMNYGTTEHDTGFLNVDDDDLEVDESHIPSIEENHTRILDNSGWSSRSRAVGKYLQIMFDKEAEQGKNVIPVDKLLVGKSRKEASRMFFETLVLKTRDYIEVEQMSPFNYINLRPQSMLMKTDF